uniref:Radical S-adenosyl methionine domain containing 1 n=1 Tax=Sinocyclocheilus grahami TaxID=75366 RepID=A0A672P914_SINGR
TSSYIRVNTVYKSLIKSIYICFISLINPVLSCRISSVFFGGGTPSLAQPSTITAVLETVSKHTRLSDDAEVTLEVNPTPAGKDRLKDFKAAGVNRFSIGVQLNDGHLRILGRDHDSQHALWTVSEARTLCPGLVSVDVMFALPGQSVKSWETELKKLLLVCDHHVSLYQLTLERGMQLFKLVDSGELSVPGDNVTAVMYNSARGVLEKAWFSSIRGNTVSEHNIGYWRGCQYIGVGPGTFMHIHYCSKYFSDLQHIFGVLENVQELGLRCSWEGLALLDSILPTMLLELEMFFKKQYTSRKTDLQRDR